MTITEEFILLRLDRSLGRRRWARGETGKSGMFDAEQAIDYSKSARMHPALLPYTLAERWNFAIESPACQRN
jgi:hypothetical protein